MTKYRLRKITPLVLMICSIACHSQACEEVGIYGNKQFKKTISVGANAEGALTGMGSGETPGSGMILAAGTGYKATVEINADPWGYAKGDAFKITLDCPAMAAVKDGSLTTAILVNRKSIVTLCISEMTARGLLIQTLPKSEYAYCCRIF